MRPTKYKWDPYDLVGLMWILTNQRKCVEKCVLECVLLAFLMCATRVRCRRCLNEFAEFS